MCPNSDAATRVGYRIPAIGFQGGDAAPESSLMSPG